MKMTSSVVATIDVAACKYLLTLRPAIDLGVNGRSDIVECLEGIDNIVTYVCSKEKDEIKVGVKSEITYHYHCAVEFASKVKFSEINSCLREWFEGWGIDIQRVKKWSDCLTYISKEDTELYYNCKVSCLHISFRMHHWAMTTDTFKYSDPFVKQHWNRYVYLQKLHSEYRQIKSKKWVPVDFERPCWMGWAMEVYRWLRTFYGSKERYKKKQMYLWGDSNGGKTTFVEWLLNSEINNARIFKPGEGKFGWGSLDVNFHEVIVIDECDMSWWRRSTMLELLEQRDVVIEVKGEQCRTICWNKPIIMISNNNIDLDAAYKNRIQTVMAEAPYWTEEKGYLEKVEQQEEVEWIEISSDEGAD